jgi:hypothetical protein
MGYYQSTYVRYRRTDTGEIVVMPWYTDSTDTVVEGAITWQREGALVKDWSAPKGNDPRWEQPNG